TSPGLTITPPTVMGRLTDSISLRPGRMPRPTWRKYSGVFSVITSSVSRAAALLTTPTQPLDFQYKLLWEPMEPTSASAVSSMTSAEPGRNRGTNGSLERALYHWAAHRSYS